MSGVEDMTGKVSTMAQQGELIPERHGHNGGTSMLEPFGKIPTHGINLDSVSALGSTGDFSFTFNDTGTTC